MSEFVNGLHERVADTARALAAAEQTGDDYAVELHSAELVDLTRIAHEHGLDLTEFEIDLRGGAPGSPAAPQPASAPSCSSTAASSS